MPEWLDGGLLYGLLIGFGGVLVALGRWLERWTRSGTRIQDLEAANPGQRLDDIERRLGRIEKKVEDTNPGQRLTDVERRLGRIENMVDRLIWRGGAVRLGPREEGSRE